MKRITVLRAAALVALTAFAASNVALAQDGSYPNRTIKIISGYTPGGNNDIGARIFAKELEARVKQPVVVENRPGGGGTIGTRFVTRSAPDGYTILYADVGSMSSMLSKNGIEVFKELTPVSLMLTGTWALYISAKHPVKTLQELVAYAKDRPGQLNFGATNIFSTLASEVLKSRTGLTFVNVPYKGQAQVSQALASGEVDLAFDSVALYRSLIDAGRIRALFLTRKSSMLPDVPTSAQAGVRDFEPDFQGGMYVPIGTPQAVVSKLTSEFTAIVKIPEVRDRIRTSLGSEPSTGSAEDLRADVEIGLKFLAEATKLANFTPE